MKIITITAACAAAALSLSACAGLPGTGGSDWAKAAVEIAKDPACGHTDILDIMLGPIPSGHVHLERSGCKSSAPAKSAVNTGDLVVAAPAPVAPAPPPAT